MVFIALAQFMSVAQNDRATFGLKGNVTKVIQSENPNIRISSLIADWETFDYEFSQTGKIISVGDSLVKFEKYEYPEGGYYYNEYFIQHNDFGEETYYYVTRDMQKRISTIVFEIDGGDGDEIDSFLYDNKGRVAEVDIKFMYVGWGFEEEEGVGEITELGNCKYYYDENDNVIRVVRYDSYEKQTYTITYQYKLFDRAGNWLIRVANCEPMGIKNRIEKRTLEY